jgi:hypothetical protein
MKSNPSVSFVIRVFSRLKTPANETARASYLASPLRARR